MDYLPILGQTWPHSWENLGKYGLNGASGLYWGSLFQIPKADLFRPFLGGGAMLNLGSVHIVKLT